MTESVIDRFEPVQIYEKQRSASRSANGFNCVVFDFFTVGQSRYGVKKCQLSDFFHAGAKIAKHLLEGDAETINFADALRVEWNVDIARRNGFCRRRKRRKPSNGASNAEQDGGHKQNKCGRGRNEKLSHQRLGLLCPNFKDFVPGRREHRRISKRTDLQRLFVTGAARDVSIITGPGQNVLV